MNIVGRNSIVKKLLINNALNPKKPHWVFIQANKNHGICNIVLSEKDKGITRISEALAKYQGQQYDSEVTLECLEHTLFNILNRESL